MSDLFEKYRFFIKCWSFVFGITAAVFSFYMMIFYVGNHDFPFMRYGTALNSGVWEGRVTQFVLPWLFLHGQVMPILGAFIGFIAFSLAVILLAKWYGMPQNSLPVVVFCLLVTLHPYIFSQLYYVHTVISVLSWHLFGVLGCIFIWRFIEVRHFSLLIFGCFCWLFALFGYVPVLEMILVVSIGKFLQEVLAGKLTDKRFLKQGISYILILAMVLVVYLLGIKILKVTRWINSSMYNVHSLSLYDAGKKFFSSLADPFSVLFEYLPYSSIKESILLFILSGLLLCVAFYRKKIWFSIGILISIFYVAFFLAYFSPYGIFWSIRIHALSVPYIAAILFVAVVVYGKKWHRNVMLLMAVIMILGYVRIDFMAQKVWYLGTIQDERAADRVRAVLLPKLNAGKHYRLAVVGNFYGRQKFAGWDELSVMQRETYREYYGYGLYLNQFSSSGLFLYEPNNPVFGDAIYLGNYLKYVVINSNLDEYNRVNAGVFARRFGDDKKELLSAADKLCAYPCKNFYYVGEKDIFLMVSDDDISRLVLKWNIENEGKY